MITLSQEAFERYVPSFRDSENRTYDALYPYIYNVCERTTEALHLTDELLAEHSGLTARLESFVYRRAAHDAMPHFDLLLTENGFGVVSNTNLAPASKERVAALRERLREEKSDARDALLLALCDVDDWRTSNAAPLRDTLLWCPRLARRYGITAEGGARIYEREYEALRPALRHAHEAAAQIVSHEQMRWLVAHQDEADRLFPYDARNVLRERVRTLMSAFVADHKPAVQRAIDSVQSWLNIHADELPEYRASSKYEADRFKPYENAKEDPCFFFA